jgi:hypothetical protein
MKNLLYKEFHLARHPTLFIFPFLGLMLLIPAYPYYVAFIYTCLSIFFVFLQGRENKDILFTVSLPVRKRDVVKARCVFIGIIEGFQIMVSVPFAVIGTRINQNPGGNPVGIEANIAFFGFVFVMYALFNLSFLPGFYRTGYKVGVPLLYGSLAVTIFILAIEASVQLIPAWKRALDTSNPERMIQQIPILIGGILFFVVSLLLAYRRSASRFERVDL